MPAAARRVARRNARRTEARAAGRADTGGAEPATPQEAAEPPTQPDQPPAPPPVEASSIDAAPDVAQRLSDLNELHDEGVLTDEQFEEAKKRVID
jgi:Short C-terminal domain